jgi:hypothetical protein
VAAARQTSLVSAPARTPYTSGVIG